MSKVSGLEDLLEFYGSEPDRTASIIPSEKEDGPQLLRVRKGIGAMHLMSHEEEGQYVVCDGSGKPVKSIQRFIDNARRTFGVVPKKVDAGLIISI